MTTKFSIRIDRASLKARITYPYPESRIFKEVSLILGASSDDLTPTSQGFVLPWHDLKKALVSVGKALKRDGVGLELDALAHLLVDEYIDDRRNARGNTVCLDISSGDIVSTLPELGFRRKLTREQIRNTCDLLGLKHGANFSVPGAGKTTTILAVHTILKHFDRVERLFVVSPLNAFISWEDEIRDIFPDFPLRVLRLRAMDILEPSVLDRQNPDVILVNYEKLRKEAKRLFPFFLRNHIHLVLDESHRVKSGLNNLSFVQIVQLADLAKRRDILSGTPMPQSYRDLEAQFDFLWAGEVLPDVSHVVDTEMRTRQINASIADKYVRTTKQELGLRDPIIEYDYVEMGPVQAELYELFRSEAARTLARMDRSSVAYFRNAGRCVVRLLQAATNPMLLGTDDEYYDAASPIPPDSETWELLSDFAKYERAAKIEHLREQVRRILGQSPVNKVVIWSYFVRNIQLLEQLLGEYNPVSIYGSVPSGSDEDEGFREGRIRKFHQDPSCRVMIANPQACGEGISLHRVCHYAIYLDRSFNAAHFLQSLDRIHRLGLNESVDTRISILVARDTIDEILIHRLNLKCEAMGRVLNDPYLLTLAYDPADIPNDEQFGLNSEDIRDIQEHLSRR